MSGLVMLKVNYAKCCIVLKVVMLSVILLNAVVPNVVAPKETTDNWPLAKKIETLYEIAQYYFVFHCFYFKTFWTDNIFQPKCKLGTVFTTLHTYEWAQ
jgi:hypothetical protein